MLRGEEAFVDSRLHGSRRFVIKKVITWMNKSAVRQMNVELECGIYRIPSPHNYRSELFAEEAARVSENLRIART